VKPCCIASIDEKDTLSLGNLEEFSLSSLWNSRQMRQLRISLLRKKNVPNFCKNCIMYINSLESHIRILK
ncbi:MAG: SPASM domain-containing protein, partial [Candidatus Omnitrophica bacterium]|nr:SPASM domain-containing protein [Candidatus Omnitrophota bacterium]